LKKSEIHPAIRECMGAFEAFRRLGFKSDDIFAAVDSSGHAYSLLRTQGKELVATVGHFDGRSEEFVRGWEEAAVATNKGEVSPADLQSIYEESFVLQNSVGLLLAIEKKGIVLPANRPGADSSAN
jgi:hypothetical protein